MYPNSEPDATLGPTQVNLHLDRRDYYPTLQLLNQLRADHPSEEAYGWCICRVHLTFGGIKAASDVAAQVTSINACTYTCDASRHMLCTSMQCIFEGNHACSSKCAYNHICDCSSVFSHTLSLKLLACMKPVQFALHIRGAFLTALLLSLSLWKCAGLTTLNLCLISDHQCGRRSRGRGRYFVGERAFGVHSDGPGIQQQCS